MVGKYKVITLCGSTRFKDEYMEAQKRLSLEGNIVISVGLFGHSGDDEALSPETKAMLDDMHKRKIDMADEIFVINVGGYIGESTKSEIDYARKHNKPVKYLFESRIKQLSPSDRMSFFLKTQNWQDDKINTSDPNSFCEKKNCPNAEEWAWFVKYHKSHSYAKDYCGETYRYLDWDGYVYWFIGNRLCRRIIEK